jgi:tRNA (guanine37-N1)-methyltransferase
VPRDALPKAQEGHYYLADLVGLEVVNERGEALGVVKRWIFNGAQDVMEVAGDRTHLVPWIPAVVRKGRFAAEANRSGVGSRLVIRFDVVTLFPEMFAAITGSGITSRALEAGLYSVTTWNPRDFTTDNYRTVDDRPYGGGPGMVMLAEPLERTLDAVKSAGGGRTLYSDAAGQEAGSPPGDGFFEGEMPDPAVRQV